MVAVDHGARLPDGVNSDKGVDRLHNTITKLMELRAEDYGTEKMALRKGWIQDVVEILDPHQNPNAYRCCQNVLVERGAVCVLVGLAERGVNDCVRGKALEALVRVAFGNERGAEAIAREPSLPQLMRTMCAGSEIPNRFAALQLAQAIAASHGPAVVHAVRGLVPDVALQLAECSFGMIPRAAVDVLVSCSFHCPDAVADVVPWSALAGLVAENETRPPWLSTDPLSVLTCGLLATNLLCVPEPPCEADASAQRLMAARLFEGRFAEYFLLALEAAVDRCEWPEGTGAFHSMGRLADSACIMASHGHSRKLVGAIPHLVRMIEDGLDANATRSALRALRSLCSDVASTEALLAQEIFRSEILEELHKSGDEHDATELLSYLSIAESMLLGAQAALDAAGASCQNAPSVFILAELFAAFAPLDREVQQEALFQALCSVPILPSAAHALASRASNVTFQAFAAHVYGTTQLCGLWPKHMEAVAAEWARLGDVPRLPSLATVTALFERSCKGNARVGGDVILEEVLPVLHLPVDGEVIEHAFAGIRGESLVFHSFATWISQVCSRVAEDELKKKIERESEEAGVSG